MRAFVKNEIGGYLTLDVRLVSFALFLFRN